MSCVFCEIVDQPDNPTFIHEFEHSVALVCFEQDRYPGYSLLLLKQHHDHLHLIDEDLYIAFSLERRQLAKALFKTYPATTRMNTANLGNVVSHVHEHLIPRHPNDPTYGGPPIWRPDAEISRLHDDEYRAIAARIRQHLEI